MYMKSCLFIPLILFAVLLTGCFDDDEKIIPEYLEFGVIKSASSSNFLIKADSKVVLKAIEGITQNLGLEDGDRVLIKYSIVQTFVGEDYDFTVKVLEIRNMLVVPILHVTNDSIRNTLSYETAKIKSAWIAQDYLNLVFNYYIDIQSYNNKVITNFFYVSKDSINQFEGGTPIVLHFHHKNKKLNQVLVEGIMCVPITELRKERTGTTSVDSVMIKVIGKDQYSTSFNQDLKYKYEFED